MPLGLTKVVCCSAVEPCPILFDPMDYSTPGFSVLCYLPVFAQILSIESHNNVKREIFGRPWPFFTL